MQRYALTRPFESFDGLLRLQEELQRAFDRPWTRAWDVGFSGRGVFPPVNVFDDGQHYVLRFEVPGLAPENLRVDTEGHTLRISGKREEAPPSGSAHRQERWSGEFARSFQLPADLDLEHTEASYEHGILTIRIPRREEARPRQIAVRGA